ncbi:MAG: substrate-binding domain-containing protein [Cohaesibacteraceae bacterium]|nr:substrate-binding domain-containing protein [Cohaesibacteraceae bacterium]
MKSRINTILGCAALALTTFAMPVHAEIKIGVLVPDSGPAGLFGPSARNAAELAKKQINAAGGINGEPIELIFADVGVPPAEASQAALRLWKGKGVKAFVGMHNSAVREALMARFKGKIPYVYTPVYEGNACAPGLYVTGETPSQQLAPVIPYLMAQKSISKWYLIGNDYNWPRETNILAKQYIAKAGGEIVGEEYLPFSVTDFDSSLQKIRESGANGVLITLVGGASVGFNVAYAGFGLDKQALRLGTLIEENTLAGIGAANANNLYSSAGYFGSIDTPAAIAFSKQYYSTFGKKAAPLNSLGQSTFEGLMLLASLANSANSLDVSAIEKIAEGTSFRSPRGKATLLGGHVAQSIYLADATGGTFNIVKSFNNVPSSEACK